MVPHIIFHQPSDRYFPGPDAWQTATAVPTSGITQPPVAASAVRWMLADSRDQTAAREQVTALFPQIFKYHQWFHDQRDPERTGLVALYHPWESGRDNSAEWDKPLSCVPTDRLRPYERRDLDLIDPEQRPRQQDYDRFVALMQIFIDHSYDQRALYIHSPFRVADLGVNMILLRANRDLLALARQIGQTAATCMTIADWISLQEQAREKLWDPQTQAFHSLDLRTGKRLPQITSAAFLPFYGGALPEPYQGPILERLKAWEDQLSFLLPSLAPDDPAFEPERYWRGPVWPVVNFLAATGLAEHGHRLQAERIRTDTAALIRDGGLREYYDPRNGAALGGDHFSWTAAMWLYWAGRQS
ncbi:MAG: neutral trehalase [Rhodospirillales bacterium]|nr:neutral trehalase [Rhodospirillales bacterium]MCB9996788.1 neutral trehalase [Rhodospirillales bacterium]